MIRYFFFSVLCCNLAWAEEPAVNSYEVTFFASFHPQKNIAKANISVAQSNYLLRELDLAAAESEFSNFSGDGNIVRAGDRLLWKVPKSGGTLSYDVQINHERDGLLDARLTTNWVIILQISMF